MTEADTYRNQSIELRSKSMDWILYDIGLRHEWVNHFLNDENQIQIVSPGNKKLIRPHVRKHE